jgi:precorrin-4/cobalt-precorrin-4 C11-methyltransferase
MVYIIGAGPGDPELITVKGLRLLAGADVVIYAGSLVNPELMKNCKPGAEIHNSAGMTLEEVLEVIRRACLEGKTVARLHTGDPALYGAIQEQMDALEDNDISFEVVPGVSSFFAAAAAIPHELTLPGVSQTVILTRIEGRTPAPEREKLQSLASHRSTMCIFLSVQLIDEVVGELIAGGYAPNTPVVVAEKASWPEQRLLRGELQNIAGAVKAAGIVKTALIMVGDVFGSEYDRSKLYDSGFTHGYRKAKQ